MNDGKLSIPQAVDYLCACQTREYRLQCIEFWRKEFGDDYADEIKRQVIEKFEKRKSK